MPCDHSGAPTPLKLEMNEVRSHSSGRCCRHGGDSGVRTSGRPPTVHYPALPGGVATAEPAPREVPLQLWEAPYEALGLPSNQVADEGVTQDATTAGPVGTYSHSPVRRTVSPLPGGDHSQGERKLRPNTQLRRRTRKHIGRLRDTASYARNQDGIGRPGLGYQPVDPTEVDDWVRRWTLRVGVRSTLFSRPQQHVLKGSKC